MSTRPLGPTHQGRMIMGRTAAALALAGAGVLAATGGANAAETCTTPGLGQGTAGEVAGTDNTANVYVGGNFTVEGAAEAEGVVVVGGNFSTNTHYNVGVAGAGSLVAPAAGSVMLRVGGDVEGQGTIDVGSGLGGDALVGGSVAHGVSFELNGGKLTDGVTAATALGDYVNLNAALQKESGRLAALQTTGTVVTDDWTTTLVGDGTSTQQVFDVDGAALHGNGHGITLAFDKIPTSSTVVVNVRGADVDTDVFDMREAGGQAFAQGADNAGLGSYASRTVWNILSDKSPKISGTAQWVGSVLVPTADGTTTVDVPGLNGRTWVAGNLVHKAGAGSGNEFHNYPFVGSEDLTCTDTPAVPNNGGDTDDKGDDDNGGDVTPPADTTSDDDTPTTDDSPATDDTPSDDQSTAPTSDEDTSSTTPADVASPSPTDTTVVLAAGGTATPTATATAQGEGVLAQTGANVVPFAVAAAVLVAAGATLLVLRRRRTA